MGFLDSDSDDDSDESSEVVPRKAPPPKAAAPAPASAKKKSAFDSDSDDDEDSDDSSTPPKQKAAASAPAPAPKAPSPAPPPKKSFLDSDSDSDDDSDDDSDSAPAPAPSPPPKPAAAPAPAPAAAAPPPAPAMTAPTVGKTKKSAFDSDSDDDDSDEDDSGDDFGKPASKSTPPPPVTAAPAPPPAAPTPATKKKSAYLDSSDEEEDDSDASPKKTTTTNPLAQDRPEEEQEGAKVARETTTDWMEALKSARRESSRRARGSISLNWTDPVVTDRLEYAQFQDSVLSVNDETHRAEPHDDIPWYNQDYQELPWYEQPDLDADDALTALCKKVLLAAEDGAENEKRLSERARNLEANVLGFALKLKNRIARQQSGVSTATGDEPTRGDAAASVRPPKRASRRKKSVAVPTDGTLFSDPDFPPTVSSLIDLEDVPPFVVDVEKFSDETGWKRAPDIWADNSAGDDVTLYTLENLKPAAVKQGLLENCYFLASLTSLSQHPRCITMMFSSPHNAHNKLGLYAVNLYCNGLLKEVIVDDWLPIEIRDDGPPTAAALPSDATITKETKQDNGDGSTTVTTQIEYADGRVQIKRRTGPTIVTGLKFSKTTTNELWVPIVEKAYAKTLGSYASLEVGMHFETIRDLTGAPGYYWDSVDAENHWALIEDFCGQGYTLSCGVDYKEGMLWTSEDLDQAGLVGNHAYALLAACTVTSGGQQVKLLKLRNPWGDAKEWTGKWGGGSDAWTQSIKQEIAKKGIPMEDPAEKDGIFWIQWEDFCQYFNSWDVNKYRDSYQFSSANLVENGNNYHLVTVHVRQPGQYTFGLSQKGNRMSTTYQYSSVRGILVRALNDDNPQNLNGCQFIKGVVGEKRDEYIDVEYLEGGMYFMFVQVWWDASSGHTPAHEISVNCYGPADVNFMQDIAPTYDAIDVLNEIFASKVRRDMKGSSNFIISKHRGQPHCSGIQEYYYRNCLEGFHFHLFSNNESTNATLQEEKEFTTLQGAELMKPAREEVHYKVEGQGEYSISVKPGETKGVFLKVKSSFSMVGPSGHADIIKSDGTSVREMEKEQHPAKEGNVPASTKIPQNQSAVPIELQDSDFSDSDEIQNEESAAAMSPSEPLPPTTRGMLDSESGGDRNSSVESSIKDDVPGPALPEVAQTLAPQEYPFQPSWGELKSTPRGDALRKGEEIHYQGGTFKPEPFEDMTPEERELRMQKRAERLAAKAQSAEQPKADPSSAVDAPTSASASAPAPTATSESTKKKSALHSDSDDDSDDSDDSSIKKAAKVPPPLGEPPAHTPTQASAVEALASVPLKKKSALDSDSDSDGDVSDDSSIKKVAPPKVPPALPEPAASAGSPATPAAEGVPSAPTKKKSALDSDSDYDSEDSDDSSIKKTASKKVPPPPPQPASSASTPAPSAEAVASIPPKKKSALDSDSDSDGDDSDDSIKKVATAKVPPPPPEPAASAGSPATPAVEGVPSTPTKKKSALDSDSDDDSADSDDSTIKKTASKKVPPPPSQPAAPASTPAHAVEAVASIPIKKKSGLDSDSDDDGDHSDDSSTKKAVSAKVPPLTAEPPAPASTSAPGLEALESIPPKKKSALETDSDDSEDSGDSTIKKAGSTKAFTPPGEKPLTVSTPDPAVPAPVSAARKKKSAFDSDSDDNSDASVDSSVKKSVSAKAVPLPVVATAPPSTQSPAVAKPAPTGSKKKSVIDSDSDDDSDASVDSTIKKAASTKAVPLPVSTPAPASAAPKKKSVFDSDSIDNGDASVDSSIKKSVSAKTAPPPVVARALSSTQAPAVAKPASAAPKKKSVIDSDSDDDSDASVDSTIKKAASTKAVRTPVSTPAPKVAAPGSAAPKKKSALDSDSDDDSDASVDSSPKQPVSRKVSPPAKSQATTSQKKKSTIESDSDDDSDVSDVSVDSSLKKGSAPATAARAVSRAQAPQEGSSKPAWAMGTQKLKSTPQGAAVKKGEEIHYQAFKPEPFEDMAPEEKDLRMQQLAATKAKATSKAKAKSVAKPSTPVMKSSHKPRGEELSELKGKISKRDAGKPSEALATKRANLETRGDDFGPDFRFELPTQLSASALARLSQLARALPQSSVVKTVSVVVPSYIEDQVTEHSDFARLFEAIGSIEGLEELTIASSRGQVRSCISTRVVTKALQGIATKAMVGKSRLVSLNIKNMMLVDTGDDDIVDFAEAMSDINEIPSFKTADVEIEFTSFRGIASQ